ncbi:MAG: DUF86 domain-containing protein [Nanoarchaeota archaeon]
MKEVSIFIKHILENINDIEEFSERLNKSKLKRNKLKTKAIIRSLEIIGEAVKNIPEAFRKDHPNIEWSKIAGLRDKLIHHYFGVDFDMVWDVINKDLPKLKEDIKKILENY